MLNHLTRGAHAESRTPLLPVLVFADVDEAFLVDAALTASVEADERLAAERVALILCSSMTRAQLEMIQQALGIRQPFICESGAAILIPTGYFPFDVPRDRDLPGYHVIDFGRPYVEVVALLQRTAQRLDIPIIGFNDESIGEVAHEYGLSLSYARLAKLREYDEPFRLVHPTRSAHERLWRGLRSAGLTCTCRGVREHVGARLDKRRGVSVLTGLYGRMYNRLVTVNIANVRSSETAAPARPSSVSRDHASSRAEANALVADRELWIDSVIGVARRARLGRGPRSRMAS